MPRNLSSNNMSLSSKINYDGIKIFDNSDGQKSQTKFIKYHHLNDYYSDCFSSDDDGELLICNNKEKLDLTESVKKIQCLNDLIKLCDQSINDFKPCNRQDFSRLKKVQPCLIELNRLIGMNNLKKKIIYQVLFYCQDLHNIQPIHDSDEEGDLMHTVIQGPPGCGKTTVAKILARIYLKLGVLKSNKFIVAKRKDLVGEFLGQTAPKTTKVLQSAVGGVLFIDEAYSLGNGERMDIYSKECLDTINQFLTEHARDLVVIIAGYTENLNKCFFSSNPGLERRFPWVYDIEKYTTEEIRQILIKQIRDSGWGFAQDDPNTVIPPQLIEKNKNLFNFGGGDTQNLLSKCKKAHSFNTFGLSIDQKSKLTKNDIKEGLKMHKESIKNNHNEKEIPYGMFT